MFEAPEVIVLRVLLLTLLIEKLAEPFYLHRLLHRDSRVPLEWLRPQNDGRY